MESTSLRQVRGWELDNVKSEVGEVKAEQKKHGERLAVHDLEFAKLLTTLRISVALAIILIPVLTAFFSWLVPVVVTSSATIEQMEKKK